MSTEDWKLQVSIKTSNGDLINIRANTSDELSVLLEGISDFSTQIAATSKMVSGAYNVSPLVTTPLTPNIAPTPSYETTQGGLQSPTCIHGARVHKSGISKKTNQPYAFWSCPEPMGTTQCRPAN